MSRRESDFEWAERQEADVRNMQPERSLEFREGPHEDKQLQMYREGWLEATNRLSLIETLAKRVLSMKILDDHPCSKQGLCIYCDAIQIALQIEGRSRAR
jgi:hypothetical protein